MKKYDYKKITKVYKKGGENLLILTGNWESVTVKRRGGKILKNMGFIREISFIELCLYINIALKNRKIRMVLVLVEARKYKLI